MKINYSICSFEFTVIIDIIFNLLRNFRKRILFIEILNKVFPVERSLLFFRQLRNLLLFGINIIFLFDLDIFSFLKRVKPVLFLFLNPLATNNNIRLSDLDGKENPPKNTPVAQVERVDGVLVELLNLRDKSVDKSVRLNRVRFLPSWVVLENFVEQILVQKVFNLLPVKHVRAW